MALSDLWTRYAGLCPRYRCEGIQHFSQRSSGSSNGALGFTSSIAGMKFRHNL